MAHEASRRALDDIGALCGQGWYWSDTTPGLLLRPDGPEVYLWHNGANGQVLYSPEVVEMMRRLRREDQKGP